MGMGGGGGTNKAVSEINVTPLIDVLLVLLIIFMVIVPVTPKGLEALVPQPPKNKTPPQTIVVQVLSNRSGLPSYRINGDSFTFDVVINHLEIDHNGKFYGDSVGVDISLGDQKAHATLKRAD